MAKKISIDPELITKKNQHNELERKRRGNIKDNFEMLFEVVPCEEHEKKISGFSRKKVGFPFNIIVKRMEKEKSDGVSLVLAENIRKIIEEAKAASVPDYSKVPTRNTSPKSLSSSTSALTTPSCGSKRSSISDCKVSNKRKKDQTDIKVSTATQSAPKDNQIRKLPVLLHSNMPTPSKTVKQSPLLSQSIKIQAPQVVNNVSYVRDTSLYGVVARDHNYEGTFRTHAPISCTATMANIPSMAPIPSAYPETYTLLPEPLATEEDCSSNTLTDEIQSSPGSIVQ
ncbi:hypothetical protein MXB_3780 [Myxobolus squamalis]|nr:hypothetical protein MXB_3780 [Myxobolus squamalis]